MSKPLSKGYKQNFETLLRAAKAGDLALLSGRIKATGEEVAILVAITKNGDEYCVVPFGHLCPDNPYDYYDDPTAT